MNKQGLTRKLQKIIPTKNFARMVVELLISEIARALRRGERVAIRGLGVFEPYIARSKHLVHPRTGQKITVSARRRVRFRLTKNFFEYD